MKKRLFIIPFILLFSSLILAASILQLTPVTVRSFNLDEVARLEALGVESQYSSKDNSVKELWAKYERDFGDATPPFHTGSPDDWEAFGGGPKEIRASSVLSSQEKNSYGPGKIHDWNLKTAWVEGKSDYGIGEYCEFIFGTESPFGKDQLPPRITTFIIYNGYQKSSATYYANSRVKELKLYINNNPHALLHLKDTPGYQTFEIDPVRSTKENPLSFKFEIVSVYPGTKYKDTAISEINLSGLDVLCFTGETQVTMADGTKKAISNVAKGDIVLSYNEFNKEYEASTVKSVAQALHTNLIRVHFQDGTSITSTDDHPYFSDRGWIAANTLNGEYYGFKELVKMAIGDRICAASGSYKEIAQIEYLKSKQLTYTITDLSKNRTFIAEGLVVGVEEIE